MDECKEIMRLLRGTSHYFVSVPTKCSIAVSSKGITFTLKFCENTSTGSKGEISSTMKTHNTVTAKPTSLPF